jgi:hypothetical protein
LNDYLHGTRAAWRTLQSQLKAGGGLCGPEFDDLAKRLAVEPADLHDRIEGLAATHRSVCLVHMVAAYEDYLKQLVQSVLRVLGQLDYKVSSEHIRSDRMMMVRVSLFSGSDVSCEQLCLPGA